MEGIEIVIVHMKIEVVVSSYLETATHISSKIEHKSRSHIISCFGILIFFIAYLCFYLFFEVDVCHCFEFDALSEIGVLYFIGRDFF